MITAHSEYGKISGLILRHVNDAFRDQQKLNDEWKALNFTSVPDMDEAREEYAAFESILRSRITNVHYISGGEDSSSSLDSIYCRDASIVTDAGVILCHMGKESRSGEPGLHQKLYEFLNIPLLGAIEKPGKLEGGDVAWLDDKTLAVGNGYRSDEAGFEQLKSFMDPIGVQLISVDLPHNRGEKDVFHLMSIFSPVDQDLAVVYSPLMPVRFRSLLLERGYRLVEVPDIEFDTMGCNVLATAPRQCMMVRGNPLTRDRLKAAGCSVTEFTGNHISMRGGGGPTCLTRPLRRNI